jgi:hypothetical protein
MQRMLVSRVAQTGKYSRVHSWGRCATQVVISGFTLFFCGALAHDASASAQKATMNFRNIIRLSLNCITFMKSCFQILPNYMAPNYIVNVPKN